MNAVATVSALKGKNPCRRQASLLSHGHGHRDGGVSTPARARAFQGLLIAVVAVSFSFTHATITRFSDSMCGPCMSLLITFAISSNMECSGRALHVKNSATGLIISFIISNGDYKHRFNCVYFFVCR